LTLYRGTFLFYIAIKPRLWERAGKRGKAERSGGGGWWAGVMNASQAKTSPTLPPQQPRTQPLHAQHA